MAAFPNAPLRLSILFRDCLHVRQTDWGTGGGRRATCNGTSRSSSVSSPRTATARIAWRSASRECGRIRRFHLKARGVSASSPARRTRTLAKRVRRGRVERWRARGSVRWRSHGFRRGPQSGSHSDVSSAPPKIPCSEFSPARLQAKVCCHQPGPSRTGPELKCQVHIPSGASRFDLSFVAYVPPADYRWHYQPARLRLTAATTLAHGPPSRAQARAALGRE